MNGSKAMIDTIAENLNQTKVPQNVEGIFKQKKFSLNHGRLYRI